MLFSHPVFESSLHPYAAPVDATLQQHKENVYKFCLRNRENFVIEVCKKRLKRWLSLPPDLVPMGRKKGSPERDLCNTVFQFYISKIQRGRKYLWFVGRGRRNLLRRVKYMCYLWKCVIRQAERRGWRDIHHAESFLFIKYWTTPQVLITGSSMAATLMLCVFGKKARTLCCILRVLSQVTFLNISNSLYF